jgi:hypothetical protein
MSGCAISSARVRANCRRSLRQGLRLARDEHQVDPGGGELAGKMFAHSFRTADDQRPRAIAFAVILGGGHMLSLFVIGEYSFRCSQSSARRTCESTGTDVAPADAAVVFSGMPRL